ncbi:hypothetical protein [Paenibacillus sp. F4]|uniref:hypothetical protein n=1 Tax=Paenibacillus sp. F4 TaxID=357385 RepID=UPI000C9F6BC6|nr:hypothetical protein [Paenibacillus sp. F4]PNQ80074.1 hypothetical protein C1T21_16005 [Paenibacillus sp. F4]
MASEKTPNLGLNQIDRTSPKTTYFDLEKYLDQNWRAVDEFAGDVNDGVNEIKKRLDTTERKAVTLEPGVQIVHAEKASPFSLTGLSGRMLVNLLGRMGGCETVSEWSSNVAIAIDNNNKTNGSSSFKITLGSASATASASFLTTPGRKYIAIADVKSGNTSKVAISINGIASAVGNEVTSGSVFAPLVVRFTAKEYFHIVTIAGTGVTGNTFNMDSVRVYEISDADYAAAASLTPAQAAAKYPYVDSVMPVRNSYAIRYGENLLPSFYEWSIGNSGIVTLQGPNKASVSTSGYSGSFPVSPLKVVVPVLPNTTYTISSTGDGLQYIERRDENDFDPTGEVMPGVVAVGTKTFTTSIQTKFLSVRLRYASTGSFTHENPMLNIGSAAKPFKPRVDSMLALQTDLYADPVTGANADAVFEREGQYFKYKNWQGLMLDGNLPWEYFDKGTGYKVVRLPIANGLSDRERVSKYDGKLIPHTFPVSAADQSHLSESAGVLGLSISVADSGWADGYQPTQDDIKAYFFGYKAYDANTITPANAQAATMATWSGTGTKYWVQRVGAANFTQSAPQTSYTGYTPYQLVYQLATPVVEPIVSEGQLSFVEGDNQVEVGSGIILRERSNPYQEANKFWNINNGTAGWESSVLSHKASKILAIYRNNKNDSNSWNITNGQVTNRGALAQQADSKHDITAVYTTTYLMMDKPPVTPFTGLYAANEKTLLLDLVESVQQANARVSVVENKKAEKDSPSWITPTLLNGWTNHDVTLSQISYLKDSMGYVHVKGVAKPGVINTNVFQLPIGYRPSRSIVAVAAANTDSGHDVLGRVNIGSNGNVAILAIDGITITNTGWVSLDSLPPFLAEK